MLPRLRSATLACAGLLLLAGCDTVSGWLGEGDAPPLPGERVAVLVGEGSLEADPAAAREPISLPSVFRNSAWPQPGGDSAHSFRHLEASAAPRVAWSASVGEGNSSSRRLMAQPVSAGGRVFTLDARRQVSAFELSGGRRVWTRDLGRERSGREDYFGGGVALGDGRVYVTTGFGSLFALDAGSGEILWETPAGSPMRAGPTYAEGRVFATTLENLLIAVDASSGEELWSYAGLEETAGLLGGASPAVAGNTVVAAFSSGEIVALLAENGQILWEDSLAGVRRLDQSASIAQIRGHPVMDQGLVVAVSNSDLMSAIDQRRGLPRWEVAVGGIQTPWVADDTIFVVSNEAQLVALRRGDGRIRWTAQLQRYRNPDDRTQPVIWAGPILAGGRLVLTNSLGEALFLSPFDGSQEHRLPLSGPVTIQPAVVDGTLLLVTEGGQLLALR